MRVRDGRPVLPMACDLVSGSLKPMFDHHKALKALLVRARCIHHPAQLFAALASWADTAWRGNRRHFCATIAVVFIPIYPKSR